MKLAPLALVLLTAVLGGCLDQKLTITSEPAGALVYVNDTEVGRTPLTIPYTYTGDLDVVLSLDGYQTLTTEANIKPAWYQIVPIDLFATISPFTHRDHRYFNYKLDRLVPPSDVELIRQSGDLKKQLDQPAPK
jgi:hypothetical protein